MTRRVALLLRTKGRHRFQYAGDIACQCRVRPAARHACLQMSHRIRDAILRQREKTVDQVRKRLFNAQDQQGLPTQERDGGPTGAELEQAKLVARDVQVGGVQDCGREGLFGCLQVAAGGMF